MAETESLCAAMLASILWRASSLLAISLAFLVSGAVVLVMMYLLMLADLNEDSGRKVLHAQPVLPGSRELLKSWHEEKRSVRIGRAMAVRPYRRLDNEELQLAGL
jgi:hypothetical protein